MRDVFDGAIVAFECLGDIHVPDHRFLNAITDQGQVRLSAGFDLPFTGAHWQCMSVDSGVFALVSAGAVPGFRYLNGRTQDGVVETVGDMLPPFSGTRWRIVELSPGVVTIQCLGSIHNPQHQFLDGRTQVGDGSVGLAPNTAEPFSGTRWATTGLPRPSVQVHTQRQQTGSRLTISGTNFTPGDGITFSADGIVGRTNHAPFALPTVANAGPTGAFTATADVGFFPQEPGDGQVIVRATDHHGRTASGSSGGFGA
jgi:hypothetical protein